MSEFIKGMYTGVTSAGIVGIIGGAIVAGVTALFGGPVAVAAAIGAGLFGLFGAALGAVATGTSPSAGDYRGNWAAGLPVAAALAFGAYALFAPAAPQNEPPKKPPSITAAFNAAGDASPQNTVVWVSAVRQPKAPALV
ncbi:MAG: hypothetical protein EPN97_11160 [Alphaproteobacteria bacterium]|nr:MAG: hypothetical protein EPN97_11160 [Alphaproteobacteria bacterium]